MPVYVTVDQRADKRLSVSIEEGSIGFRIAGAKYDGTGKTLLRREITASDKTEIMRYLRHVKA